jgi:hypothetical protein
MYLSFNINMKQISKINIFPSKQFKETLLLYNVNEMNAMIKLKL